MTRETIYHVRAREQSKLLGRVYAFCDACGLPLLPAPITNNPSAFHPHDNEFAPCCDGAGIKYEATT